MTELFICKILLSYPIKCYFKRIKFFVQMMAMYEKGLVRHRLEFAGEVFQVQKGDSQAFFGSCPTMHKENILVSDLFLPRTSREVAGAYLNRSISLFCSACIPGTQNNASHSQPAANQMDTFESRKIYETGCRLQLVHLHNFSTPFVCSNLNFNHFTASALP